ncbi:unnamed protein product [Sphagnum compactum]
MARSIAGGRRGHVVTLLLMMSLLLAVSMWGAGSKAEAAAASSVTVLNEALVPVSVYVNGGNVQVATGPLPVHVNVEPGSKETAVEVSLPGKEGQKPIYVNVKNGDTIVIIPNFLGGGMVDVNVNGIFKGHL